MWESGVPYFFRMTITKKDFVYLHIFQIVYNKSINKNTKIIEGPKNMNKEKIISTSNFKIENNIISFNDVLLQISNISSVSVEPVAKKKFEPWFIVIFFLGIFGAMQPDEDIKGFGIVFVVISVAYICWLLIENYGKNEKYLYISLNSGFLYYIICENERFLQSVMEIIEYCINHHYIKNIQIDFNECRLYNSPITVGDGKEVINTVITGNNNSVNINNWEQLQDELIKVYEKLPKTSEEYAASGEALKYALSRDEDGLMKVFNKYSKCFLSDVFKGVASGLLVDIIKSMLL